MASRSSKLRVGTTVTNAVISYNPLRPERPVFSENFDGVTAPALPVRLDHFRQRRPIRLGDQHDAPATPRPMRPMSPDAANVGISELVSPSIALPAGQSRLSFPEQLQSGSRHRTD